MVDRQAAEMAVDYLLQTEFAGVSDPNELAELSGMSVHNAGLMLERKQIMHSDLLEMCDARGIDFGVTLRFSDSREVTFMPSVNFGASDQSRRTKSAEEEKETKA